MNVICLVLDSLRADRGHLDSSSLTPNLDSLGKNAFVFTNAVATGSWTVPSHGSLFTGQYPSNHGATADFKSLPQNGSDTTAELLSKEGYESVCVTTNPWLTDEFGFNRGFTRMVNLRDDPPFPDTPDPRESVETTDMSLELLKDLTLWCLERNPVNRIAKAAYLKFVHERTHPDATDVVDSLVEEMEKLDGPSFVFANFMDAHEPYFTGEDRKKTSWNLHSLGSSPSLPEERITSAYDDTVRCMDRELGRYFEYLREKEAFDDSLIIVLGDHGQALGEHGYWGHGTYLHSCLTDVPLLIKPPNPLDGPVSIEEPFSIRKLHSLILDFVREEGEMNQERIKRFTEPIVVSESAGPHMNCAYPSDMVDEEGYISFKSEDWMVIRHESTERLEIITNSHDLSLESIEREIQGVIQEYDLGASETSDDVEMSTATEQQLEDLGYI